MGYREISFKMSTDFSEDELRTLIAKKLGIHNFSYSIEGKSLDARKKNNIFWLIKIIVSSDELKGGKAFKSPELDIPVRLRKEKAVIAGSGPAGFFTAFVLQKAGFKTILLERGKEVTGREKGIYQFEKEGKFDPLGNYAFGEGGAGTFSDGKLTSRSKHITREKQLILDSYIKAGAPAEIAYMAHPHLGSDKLKVIVKNLREQYKESGGIVHFETFLNDLEIKHGKVSAAITNNGAFEGDYFVLATGHSAFETYRMLIRKGIVFRTKNLAIGSRMEHSQQIINLAQWGKENLPGVKAAEYRLTSNSPGMLPVYTFCMCPGGIIVPSAAYRNTNIVNGMSMYMRDLKFANAACVAAVNPSELFGREAGPEEVLDWVEALEMKFFEYSGGFRAPFCQISDFIDKKEPRKTVETSYPLGLKPAPLWELLPEKISTSLRNGLTNFNRKIRGFDTGIIMGLESKTSAPIQALREENGLCTGFKNLYIAGEGSGYAGGIISSGADGIRIALRLI